MHVNPPVITKLRFAHLSCFVALYCALAIALLLSVGLAYDPLPGWFSEISGYLFLSVFWLSPVGMVIGALDTLLQVKSRSKSLLSFVGLFGSILDFVSIVLLMLWASAIN